MKAASLRDAAGVPRAPSALGPHCGSVGQDQSGSRGRWGVQGNQLQRDGGRPWSPSALVVTSGRVVSAPGAVYRDLQLYATRDCRCQRGRTSVYFSRESGSAGVFKRQLSTPGTCGRGRRGPVQAPDTGWEPGPGRADLILKTPYFMFPFGFLTV